MKKLNLLFYLTFVLFSQEINHKILFDLNNDGHKETILFEDNFAKEFDYNQFNRIYILNENDTLKAENKNIWVPKKELYQNANINLQNRIGIFKLTNSAILWLTGFQYACCINVSSFYHYDGQSLKKLYQDEFKVDSIFHSKNEVLIYGSNNLQEPIHGDFQEKGFVLFHFKPYKLLKLSSTITNDEELEHSYNLSKVNLINKNVDIYNSFKAVFRDNSKPVLISTAYKEKLVQREYAITSLRKLNENIISEMTLDSSKLKIMRNELFAIYGYKFRSKDLNEYFSKKKWYKPHSTDANLIASMFSSIEKYNVLFLNNLEWKLKSLD